MPKNLFLDLTGHSFSDLLSGGRLYMEISFCRLFPEETIPELNLRFTSAFFRFVRVYCQDKRVCREKTVANS